MTHLVKSPDTLENDYQKILIDWNNTERDFPKNKTLTQLFEEQVARSPQQIAIVCDNLHLRYEALNKASNQLARKIEQHYHDRQLSIIPDTLIALSLDRSIDMFIAMLAILKTGAAYVPIDPNTPRDRLRFILEDTNTQLLLTQQHKLATLLESTPSITQLLAVDSLDYHSENDSNLEKPSIPDSLIYVIYTSGTTGKPKGVMISHQNIINYYTNVSPYFDDCEYIDFSTNLAFDLSVTTTLIPLLCGKKIIIYSGELRDIENYITHLQKNNIDFIKSTPSFLTQVFSLPQFTKIKVCFVGGEKLLPAQLDNLLKHCDEIYDEYGPTENTVGTLLIQKTHGKQHNGLIGKPYFNHKVYVLNEKRLPVSIGVIGELYVGGAGVARGYLNQPALTAERFIQNPFSDHAEILYKTSDLVRWLPDGNLEYIGRNDFQVKINGYRIELNEIEQALSSYASILQSIVLVRDSKLFSYYLSEKIINEKLLISHLMLWLPDYMLPHHLIHMKTFPLTVNGKIDREALLQQTVTVLDENYLAPRNALEKKLCTIWEEILVIEKIGIRDDFFKLGGDSIKCMQVMALLLREGIDCRVKDIYTHRSIQELCAALGKKRVIHTESGVLMGDMDLLPIQSWFFEQTFPKVNHWNQSFLVRVPLLSIEKLNAILPLLIEHHDVLRVCFPKRKDDRRCATYGASNINITVKQLKTPSDDTFTAWQNNFDIENGPLWQIGYVTGYADGSARLYFAFHHLIMDTVSWRILTDDLKRLYNGEVLGNKSSSYRQWVNAIHHYTKKYPEESIYWENSANNDFHVSPLSKTQQLTSFTLNADMTKQLIGESNKAYHTDINDLLLSALSLALSNFFGKNTHRIMLEGHGREAIDDNLDITRTVGWFTTLFPVTLTAQSEVSETIVFLKEYLHAIPNKGMGYGAFRYTNALHSFPADFPKITFNYLGQFDSTSGYWQVSETFIGETIHPSNKRPHVFDIIGSVIDGSLKMVVSSYLSKESCADFSSLFEKQLIAVTNHCMMQINNANELFTPSDFNSLKINPALLNNLQKKDKTIEAIYRANSLQQGFIYHAITQPESDAYRVQLLLDYYAPINVDAYKMAWDAVIATHPILRTYFNSEESLIQIVSKQGHLDFQLHDLTNSIDKEKKLIAIQGQDRALPFNLEKPTLMRLHLVQLEKSHFVLIKNSHHSILDGWSLSILINQVHAHYLNFIRGQNPEIVTDKTYLHVQTYIAENSSKAISFWDRQLKDINHANDIQSLLNKPTDLDKIKILKKPCQSSILETGENYTALKNCAKESGLTLNIIVQYAWHKLIQGYTSDDITMVGTTVSGRSIPISGIDESIGLYINTLPLIISWDDENTILQQLQKLGSQLVNASDHSFVPLASLQKNGERLFHTLVISEYDTEFNQHEELPFSSRGTIEVLDYPLALIIKENNQHLILKLKYDQTILSDKKAEELLSLLQCILQQIPDKIHLSHQHMTILSDSDYRKIIYDWNNTETQYASNRTIHHLFEDQALKTPNATALIFNNQKLSYKTLNEKANQLAHLIQSKNPNTVIPIFFDYSFEMVISILAALKSGNAYVPIDTSYPEKRIAAILKDINSRLILTSPHLVDFIKTIASKNAHVIGINEDSYQNQKIAPLENTNSVHDLAYVIYTSGTTGLPKGVMISHQNVSNYLASITKNEAYVQATTVDCSSSIAFDATVAVLLAPLISGRCVVLFHPDNKRDTHLYLSHVKNNAIDLIRMTPSFLSSLLVTHQHTELSESFAHLRCLIVGGEKASVADIKAWMTLMPGCHVINHYGPTETTVACSLFTIHDINQINTLNTIPLGMASHNHQFYVLDHFLNPVPIGAIGELYIGGDGVSKGYFNQLALTQEKFVANPFLKNTRLYKTGDLVRYFPDGNLELIGRNDFQVKIRGYRVELNEVEKIILTIDAIKQCIVMISDEKLVAYYVSNTLIDSELLKNTLEKHLPNYMIPNVFIKLDAFPLTHNGKLDRKSLPKPTWLDNTTCYTPPRDELESLLCMLWQIILNVERVGIHDDFFRLGGHSIIAIHLIHRISQATNRHISVTDLFKYKTIAALSTVIRSGEILKNIAIADKENTLLSFAQEQLWFIEQYEGGTDAFHIPLLLSLDTTINIPALENALQAIVMRHEVLRTIFYRDKYGIYQQTVKNEPLNIVQQKVNQATFSLERQKWLEKIFDLTTDYPIRACLFNVEDNHSVFLMIIFHHTAFDAWSKNIFLSELQYFYDKKEEKLAPLFIHYKDFSMWQRDVVTQNMDLLTAYWKTTLQDYEHLSFPTDYPRPAAIDYRGDTVHFQLSKTISVKLKQLSESHGVTLYTTLLTAFILVLSKYTGKTDILIGSPSTNRQHAQLLGLIGFFVNLLPLRIQLNAKISFKQALQLVQTKVIEAHCHQDLPFSKLIEQLAIERDTSYHPLFQLLFNVDYSNDEQSIDSPWRVIQDENDYRRSKLDLSVSLQNKSDGLYATIQYATSLFRRETIEQFSAHYKNSLRRIVDSTDFQIKTYSLLSPENHQKIVYDWNNTEQDYPRDKTIHQLFEEQAVKTPEKIALVYENETLTYQALNEKANQLANAILKQYDGNILPDSLIAFCLNRSIDMIISLFAILKAGAAYVPIEPHSPPDRIRHILNDTKCSLLLIHTDCLPIVKNICPAHTRLFVLDQHDYQHENNLNLKTTIQTSHLAYVIYTSGTTGLPKGVMVPHQGVVNIVHHIPKKLFLNENSRVLQFASIAFDAAALQIFNPLTIGATLFITSESIRKDADALAHFLKQHKITYAGLPPVLLAHLNPNDYPDLTTLVVAGDATNETQMKRWRIGRYLINAYGPTENTIGASLHQYELTDSNKNIGKPLPNVKAYVLDQELMPVPIGIIGELYLGGVGVTRGYLNNPELTEARFIPNPFSNGKLYKTGDLVRWLDEGNLEFIGRNDFQVKIRGYRVELNEIEKTLLTIDGIQQCVVIAREEKLVAYYSCQSKISSGVLKNAIEKYLPYYMVPSIFVPLTSFPLTTNGKIDRKSLPEPIWSDDITDYVAPKDAVETLLCALWQEALNIERIGINDDFFRLGGHSILAAHLSHKMSQATNQHIAIADIFKYKTISQLSMIFKSRNALVTIEPTAEKYTPLSFAQERLWFIEQYEGGTDAYHIPMLLKLATESNISALEYALQAIIHRHEALRTVFIQNEKGIYQQYVKEDLLSIQYKKINEGAFLFEKELFHHKNFNLTEEYPLRACLFHLMDTNTFYFMLIFHHVAFDGWSKNIFMSELSYFYNAMITNSESTLAPLSIHYNDFSIWQRAAIAKRMNTLMTYWKEKLNACELLAFPTDYTRPAMMDYHGDVVTIELHDNLLCQLSDLAHKNGATLFSVLLSGFSVLLSKYTGQTDLLIGTPIVNREHPQLNNLIGLFVNSLVLRIQMQSSDAAEKIIQSIQKTVFEAQQYQDLPFEQLINGLNIARDTTRHPLFQILFTVYDNTQTMIDATTAPPWTPVEFHGERQTAKFDLAVSIQTSNITEKTTKVSIQYATALFKKETIQRFANHYTTILNTLMESTNQPIASYVLLSPLEHQKIIYDWNEAITDYPREKTIQSLFEVQAQKTPNNIALVFENAQLTYRELDEKSNQLAHFIRAHYQQALHPETLIGLCVERSFDSIIGILGILKSGAAYVPIDPSYPKERIDYIIHDTECQLILTQKKLRRLLTNFSEKNLIFLDENPYQHNNIESLPNINASDHLAYVMYTSGTTGFPKGVMIEHRSVVCLLHSQLCCKRNIAKKGTLWTNIIFDVSVYEIFSLLATGAELHILSDEIRLDAKKLFDFILDNKIESFYVPPFFVEKISNYFLEWDKPVAIRQVLLSVEPIQVKHLSGFTAKNIAIVNAYGPTETTVFSTAYFVEDLNTISGKRLPIGQSLYNESTYILDENLSPVPMGVIGELYLGGEGLARGYLKKPELTAERFISNPFVINKKIYKTGDLARFLSDGNIDYIGRRDFQVKIHGVRIELGEIEQTLMTYPGIDNNVVLVHEKKLIAYYTGQKNKGALLRRFMATKLPDALQPAVFVFIEKLPLHANGKLNRGALPIPIIEIHHTDYVSPRNATDEKICLVWQEILDNPSIGITDDFFTLGGDSIASIQVISKLRYEAIHCSIKDIFQYRTIERLTDHILENTEATKIKAEQGILEGTFDLLPIQQWFFEQSFPIPNHWNQAFLVRVPPLSVTHLQSILPQLMNRHDMLRIRFVQNESGKWQQHYEASLQCTIEKLTADSALIDNLNAIQSGLNITTGPLWKMAYIDGYADGCARLFFTGHHLMIDTVSWRILINDLNKLYHNEKLGAKTSSYREWLHSIETYSTTHQHEIDFWKKQISAERIQCVPAAHCSQLLTLNETVTAQLIKDANRAYHTKTEELLLSALAYALHHITGENQYAVTLEGHGRELPDETMDVSETVGWFTTFYPIHIRVKNNLSETIQCIKDHCRDIPNKGIGYSAIFGTKNLPPIYFNYLGQSNVSGENWSLISEKTGTSIHPDNHYDFLILANATISDGKLSIKFGLRLETEQFHAFVKTFETALIDIAEHCQYKINHNQLTYTSGDFKTVRTESDLTHLPLHHDAASHYYPFEMTPIQKAYAVGRLKQFEIGNVANHIYTEFYFKRLDEKKLEKALNKLIESYSEMRTVFEVNNLMQQYLPFDDSLRYKIIVEEFDAPYHESALSTIRNQLTHFVYDISTYPLFHFRLSRFEDKDILHTSFDLLLLDAQTRTKFFTALTHLYHHENDTLQERSITFRDYQVYMGMIKSSPWYDADKKYWREKLPLLPLRPKLLLACDPRSIEKPYFKLSRKTISPDIWQKFKKNAEKNAISYASVLLSLYGYVLSRYTETPDFLITMTLFNRYGIHKDINNLWGDFTSTNLFGFSRKNGSAKDFFKATHDNLWDDIAHALYTGLDVQRDLMNLHQLEPTIAVSPIVFTCVVGDKKKSEAPSYFISPDEQRDQRYWIGQTSQAWIDLQATERDGTFSSGWLYVSQLFSDAFIDSLNHAYCDLIGYLAENDWNAPLPTLALPKEHLSLITAANSTHKKMPSHTLVSLFESQVDARRNATAIIDKNGTYTYQQLQEKSQSISNYLHKNNIKHNELIGVLCEKSFNQVAATLGIMKACAAYLPLNVEWPIGRINDILIEGGVSRLLVSEMQWAVIKNTPLIKAYHVHRIEILNDDYTAAAQLINPNDPAYVIFTSGSTGKPKGVCISHAGAVNTILAVNKQFNIHQNDAVLALSELSFDLSVYDLFGLLGAGGVVVFPDQALVKEPTHWAALIKKHNITLWNTVPQLMRLLLDNSGNTLSHLRTVLLSGDWVPLSLVSQVKALPSAPTVFSLGGATEASIWSIWYEILETTHLPAVPYGFPMPNQNVYVLNTFGEHCPVGVAGEIHLGGDGLALNYWRDSDKTEQRFIHHKTLGRLYKTGDLGKWSSSGYVEFLGRQDNQVKRNGNRVELDEIAAKLTQLKGIDNALVRMHEDRLIAYLVSSDFKSKHTDEFNIEQFKLAQHGLRTDLENSYQFDAYAFDESDYRTHKSYRQFSNERIPNGLILLPNQKNKNTAAHQLESLNDLALLLSVLSAKKLDDKILPKYCYPSAGSTYAVQCYVHIPDSLETLASGCYYYHPILHSLQYVQNTAITTDFSIEFRVNQYAIETLYGKEWERMAHIECGHMLYLLTHLLEEKNIGYALKINETDDNQLASLILNRETHTIFSNQLDIGILHKKNAGVFENNDRHFNLNNQPISIQTSALGHIIHSAQTLFVFEGEENSIGWIEAGYKAQQCIDYWTTLKLAYCSLGLRPYANAIYTLALGVMRAEDILSAETHAVGPSFSDGVSRALSQYLPCYMLPQVFITLENLPLTANGKIDFQALPLPDFTAANQSYVAPTTDLEKTLCEVWESVLGLKPISITDDFFRIGGDSILSIHVTTKLRQLGLLCDVLSIFEYRSIEKLAPHIKISTTEVPGISDAKTDFHTDISDELLEQLQARYQN
ncbi:MAG: amino acid adenylation domain-containing protein [Coxiellaceae bacterium]|nr:amino acid adenylation domain-containing protein [Coxiellaceae bacterium]